MLRTIGCYTAMLNCETFDYNKVQLNLILAKLRFYHSIDKLIQNTKYLEWLFSTECSVENTVYLQIMV